MPRRADLRLGLEVVAVYIRVRLLLRRDSLPEVLAALRAEGARWAGGGAPGDDPWRCAFAVVRVLRLVPGDSRCLVRSLVLYSLLVRRREAPELVIGVMPAPAFGAHAWVELGGTPLLKPGEAAGGRLVGLG